MGGKGINTKLNKRNLSRSIVNTIRGKYLRGLGRLNKGKKNIIARLLKTGIIGLKDWLY